MDLQKKIKKRNGQVVEFLPERIKVAVLKAAESTKQKLKSALEIPENFAEIVYNQVYKVLEEKFFLKDKIPGVEDIQDIVEKSLVELGFFDIAKTFILYRAERAKQRAQKRIEQLKKFEKNLLRVTKFNGKIEKFDINKLKKVFKIAAKGLEKECKFEKVFENFKLTLVDKIKTKDIARNFLKCVIDQISVNNVNWQLVAGRLLLMDLYKQACRNRKISHKQIYDAKVFKEHFDNYIKKGLYYKDFYKYYSDKDIIKAGKHLNKDQDFKYGYSTILAFSKRYLLNPNGVICELPQEMYMAVALFLAIPEKKENRLSFALSLYEVISQLKLSLATPTLLNARTNYHQLSSCFKLNVDDDLRAIYHSIENMAQISKFGGGIGVYLGHIRSKGAPIRGVKGASGGVIPWTKVINDTACAVNQLGSRLGAISPTLDIWHKDILDFLDIQTETGDIRAKAFDVFPAISVPDLFMKRVENNQDWTLFDPYEIYKLYNKRLEDFYGKEFEDFYLELEKDDRLELKETINAKDLMKKALKTTVETGMPYFFFRDTVNRANPNKHCGMVYSTQLCTEICQNTKETKFLKEIANKNEISINYQAGETVVCNLASINLAKVNTDAEIKKTIPIALRALDNVITLNFYPIKEAEITARKYRSIGLGFMGLAEFLACRKLNYDSQEARDVVDLLFEKFAYAVIDESNKLAEERGKYELFDGSDWSKGLLFNHNKDWFKKNSKMADKWIELIDRVKKTGLRFSYHLAPAPNTSTSGVIGTTAGLLPIYKRFFIETNVIAPTVTVAPNLNKENFWYYKEYVDLNMKDVIEMIAVIYKWIDQSISFEWLINPEKTSPKDLFDYYLLAWKKGIKTIYYLRSMSIEVKNICEGCAG